MLLLGTHLETKETVQSHQTLFLLLEVGSGDEISLEQGGGGDLGIQVLFLGAHCTSSLRSTLVVTCCHLWHSDGCSNHQAYIVSSNGICDVVGLMVGAAISGFAKKGFVQGEMVLFAYRREPLPPKDTNNSMLDNTRNDCLEC